MLSDTEQDDDGEPLILLAAAFEQSFDRLVWNTNIFIEQKLASPRTIVLTGAFL